MTFTLSGNAPISAASNASPGHVSTAAAPAARAPPPPAACGALQAGSAWPFISAPRWGQFQTGSGPKRVDRSAPVKHGGNVVKRAVPHGVARLHRAGADMRRQDHVGQGGEARVEIRLGAEDIKAGSEKLATGQRVV